jgi:hypothetical protein
VDCDRALIDVLRRENLRAAETRPANTRTERAREIPV